MKREFRFSYVRRKYILTLDVSNEASPLFNPIQFMLPWVLGLGLGRLP